MSAVLRFWLPALALLVLVILLFGNRCESEGTLPVESPTPKEKRAPDLMTADGDATPSQPTPVLAPRPATGPDTRRGPVRVEVLGPGATPLPGAGVHWMHADGHEMIAEGVLSTDAFGEAVLPAVPHDGSVRISFLQPQPWRKPESYIATPLKSRLTGESVVPVTGADMVHHAETGLHVDVLVVNAETGGAIDGVKLRCRKALGEEGRDWAKAPRRFLMTPAVGRRTVLHWDLEPPPGWVSWEKTWIETTISPYAKELLFVCPLRHEMGVTVTPLGPEGTPVAGRIHSLHVAGYVPGAWSVEGDAYGRLHLKGVPFLRDEILDIGVCRKDFTGPANVRAVIPDHPGTVIDLKVTLPVEGEIEQGGNESIGLGGGAGGSFKGRVRRSKHTNSLLVTVLRRGGEPAVGAQVMLPGHKARTDARGRARFEGLAPGRSAVQARQVGLLSIEKRVEIPERGEARLTLREGQGGAVELTVLDDLGRPLPFATFSVTMRSDLAWIDMEGARQRIDPFTDHLGRRVLSHLEPGSTEIRVEWGSRGKVVNDRVVEGETVPVRVVLRRPAR